MFGGSPVLKRDSIKGSGDVRFSFVDKEFEQLKRQFDINLKPEESKELE